MCTILVKIFNIYLENEQPIRSQGILRSPNKRTARLRISSAHCGCRDQAIRIMGIQY